MNGIVPGPLLRITEHLVGFGEQPESGLIPRLGIVGMQASREQPVDPMNRLGLSVRADLQNFVIVLGLVHRQSYRVGRREFPVAAPILRLSRCAYNALFSIAFGCMFLLG